MTPTGDSEFQSGDTKKRTSLFEGILRDWDYSYYGVTQNEKRPWSYLLRSGSEVKFSRVGTLRDSGFIVDQVPPYLVRVVKEKE